MNTSTPEIRIQERRTVTVPVNGVKRVPFVVYTRFQVDTEVYSVTESLFTVFSTHETGGCREWKVVFDYRMTKATARRLAKLLGYDRERIEKRLCIYGNFLSYGIRW